MSKKRTRGSKYSDEQVIYMAVLKALGRKTKAIALLFNTDNKTVTRCIKRGYSIVDSKLMGENSPFSPISERTCKILYVGGTTEIEQIGNKVYDY